MQTYLLVLWTLFMALSQAGPAYPTITATAALGFSRRQDDNGPGFFGYAQEGSEWVIQTCAGSMVFVTSSSYAACQPASQTMPNNIPSTCIEGSIIEYPATRVTCPGDTNACMTILIHSDTNDDSPTSMLFCHTATGEHSVYVKTTGSTIRSRSTVNSSKEPRPTTSESQISSESLSPIADQSASTSVPTTGPTQSGPPAASTNTNSTSPDSSSPPNMAWIAGPVVGGVAALVIIGLLVWILKLRRRQKSMVHEVSSTTGLHPPDKAETGDFLELQNQYQPGELHTQREPVELHPNSVRAELYNPPTRLELDTPKVRLELQG